MTKSTITRERIQRIIRAIDSEAYDEEEIREWLSSDEIMELSRIALAAMDSEPVAWTWRYREQWHVTNDEERARDLAWDGVKVEPLYLHAQPALVVSADLLHTAASAIEDLLTTKDRTGAGVWFDLPFRLRSAANAQPAPVVVPNGLRLALSNAGIAAPESDEMLAATCEKYIQALVAWVRDRKPFQSAPLVSELPAPVVPDDVLDALQKVARIRLDLNEFDGDRRGIADCLGDAEEALIEVVNRRAAMLAAAPQSPGSEPATVPGKWIPVSERMPEKNQNVLISVNFDSDLVDPLICSARYTGSTFRRGDVTVKPGTGIEEATHWMPLPSAPQEVK